jgi:hypothetical protein
VLDVLSVGAVWGVLYAVRCALCAVRAVCCTMYALFTLPYVVRCTLCALHAVLSGAVRCALCAQQRLCAQLYSLCFGFDAATVD